MVGDRPRTNPTTAEIRNRMTATKKMILAISIDRPAIPPKPRTRRDQGDDQEGQSPAKHGALHMLRGVTASRIKRQSGKKVPQTSPGRGTGAESEH